MRTGPGGTGPGGTGPGGTDPVGDDAGGLRRAIGLTALGTLIPGAGLTQTRHRRLGWVLVVVALLSAVALAAYVLTRGTLQAALQLASRPGLLRTAAIVLGALGLVWCASIVLTAVRARPARLDRRRTGLLAAFTAVMVLLVAGLSYQLSEYATITGETVQTVFGATPGQSVVRGEQRAGAQVVQGDDPWRDTPRVNVLLLGSDAGVGREGTRTDSMIVASMDTKTGRTVLISLPRSLERVPFPASNPLHAVYPRGYGVPRCLREGGDPCLLNAVWAEADEYKAAHPGSFAGEPSPGRATIRDVIGETLGIRIDHTVVIDLKGFEQLVDAMGGIDLNVQLGPSGRLPIGGYFDAYRGRVVNNEGWFTAGRQHLNGHLALWYARARATDDDTYRMGRQRCVIRAVLDQVNPGSMITQYAKIAQIAQDNIYTDIPAGNLPAFVELVQRVQSSTIVSLPLTPPTVYAAAPNFAKIHTLVQAAINPPPPPPAPKPSGTTSPAAPTTTTTTPSSGTTTATVGPDGQVIDIC
ncbi:MAG TPA: LCP family protein [Intrasporangium sp.]|uniref:LCP family protein n=1 Tax=Intrasporangium sp. TaxID=1925024 RepID=UPI002D78092D|nr:LCP family protein [Intrasporangium sp.]HET7399915.1 LCP family protein [Intrasporangium sp.]